MSQNAPLCLLLLPRGLDGFILREQAEDLLGAPGVVAAGPPRLRPGILARLPTLLGDAVARGQARRVVRRVRREHGGAPIGVVVVFHPIQEPLGREVVRAASAPDRPAELWYGRWDRYEFAYDAGPALRERLSALHARAARSSALTFVASTRLLELEREVGRDAVLIGLSAGDFPAPEPVPATREEVAAIDAPAAEAIADADIVALSLGHLGRRVDWALVRGVCEQVPGLVLLLVGARHDDEMPGDEDFAWCRESPQCVWLGRRTDAEAATLLRASDVGILPFRVEPFNDAGLPYRILKAARLGRRTVTPMLAGVLTWERAVRRCADADDMAAALREAAGAREHPDLRLREWALGETAAKVNAPLWERLRDRGVDTGGR